MIILTKEPPSVAWRFFAVFGVIYLSVLAMLATAFGLHYAPIYRGYAAPLPDVTEWALRLYPLTWLFILGAWPLYQLGSGKSEQQGLRDRDFTRCVVLLVLASFWTWLICFLLWLLKWKMSAIVPG